MQISLLFLNKVKYLPYGLFILSTAVWHRLNGAMFTSQKYRFHKPIVGSSSESMHVYSERKHHTPSCCV